MSLCVAKHEDLRHGLQGIFLEFNSSLGRITPLPQDNPDSWTQLVFLLGERFMCRLLPQMTLQLWEKELSSLSPQPLPDARTSLELYLIELVAKSEG